jgi:hypothetical protein
MKKHNLRFAETSSTATLGCDSSKCAAKIAQRGFAATERI